MILFSFGIAKIQFIFIFVIITITFLDSLRNIGMIFIEHRDTEAQSYLMHRRKNLCVFVSLCSNYRNPNRFSKKRKYFYILKHKK